MKFSNFLYSKEVPEFEVSEVAKAYLGKADNCMCGCGGNYAYNVQPDHAWQGEMNPKLVASRVKLFKKWAENAKEVEVLLGDEVILSAYNPNRSRMVVLYFKEGYEKQA